MGDTRVLQVGLVDDANYLSGIDDPQPPRIPAWVSDLCGLAFEQWLQKAKEGIQIRWVYLSDRMKDPDLASAPKERYTAELVRLYRLQERISSRAGAAEIYSSVCSMGVFFPRDWVEPFTRAPRRGGAALSRSGAASGRQLEGYGADYVSPAKPRSI